MAVRKPITKQEVAKPVAKEVAKPKPVVKPVEKESTEETRTNVKAMDFVPVWQGAESAEEVNEHFGREGIWASSFASRLRKMGVKVKKMARGGGGGGARLNIDELNALIG